MGNLRTKFTKWYYRKGYRMIYVPCSYGKTVPELIFICPWWVRLLTHVLFSPCVYYQEAGYGLDDIIESRINGWKQREVLLGSDE